MTAVLLSALLAGLAGSPHCVAMCGGFAASCGGPREGLLAWHAGRLVTYAALGALAGAAGLALPGPRWLAAAVAAALLLWFALALAGLVPEPRVRVPALVRAGQRLAGAPGQGSRFLFGMATGLLPCGLVYSALSVPVALADPLPGAAAMLAFGLGTVPALTLLAGTLQRLLARDLRARRLVALLVLVAGLAAIGARLRAPDAPASGAHHGH